MTDDTGDDIPTTKILVDGEPVQIKKQKLTLLVHPGEMEIEAPDHVLIDPETTVAKTKLLTGSSWYAISQHPYFLKAWHALWGEVSMPADPHKANLAIRHSIGLIIMLVECKWEGKQPFIKMPETYLHPKQAASIISMLLTIFPDFDSTKEPT